LDVPWITTAPIWKRDSLLRAGLFWDEDIIAFQDVAFHFQSLVNNLKYKMVDTLPDCYHRLHKGTRVGDFVHSVKGIASHERLFHKMYHELKKRGLLNEKRMIMILNSIFFSVINKYIVLHQHNNALSVIKNLYKSRIINFYSLIGLFQYVLACLIFDMDKRIRFYYNKICKLIWRNSYYFKFPSNYLSHKYRMFNDPT
jgi:hypothetical protein